MWAERMSLAQTQSESVKPALSRLLEQILQSLSRRLLIPRDFCSVLSHRNVDLPCFGGMNALEARFKKVDLSQSLGERHASNPGQSLLIIVAYKVMSELIVQAKFDELQERPTRLSRNGPKNLKVMP